MPHEIQTFVVADPRDFDGDCFEVAERAVAQLVGIAAVLDKAIPATLLMVRNAEMERNLIAGGEADAAEFDGSAQGRRWDLARLKLSELRRDLGLLRKAASFNPRAPIR